MKYLTAILAIALTLTLGGVAAAEDKMLETTIDSVVEATTSTGTPYIRAIITEERTIDGIAYPRSLPLMFFGQMATEAATLKAGDAIKVIASYREFQGRPSYTALKIVQ